MPKLQDLHVRFWSKVNVLDPSQCWEWKASKLKDGYGLFWYQNKNQLAHRVAWILTNGEIPEGLDLLHDPITCKNKNCCNPNHLRLGDQAANGQDPDVAILDWEKVEYARSEYASGNKTQVELAVELGVGQPHISSIILYKVWKR